MNTTVKTVNLEAEKAAYLSKMGNIARRIIICAGTGCVANGSLKVMAQFKKAISEAGMNVVVELKEETPEGSTMISRSGCQGFCQMGPLVTIEPDNILYTRVRVGDVAEIVEETLRNGKIVERLLYPHPETGKPCKGTGEIPFYTRQSRTVLKECGYIEPENIDEYIANDGYVAARKAYTEMTDEEVCKMILDSGLRGRGGGGFPTGRKWDLARIQPEGKKYIICNGDEGDPGAFMDRSVMEGNPHSVLEGMMIAAKAIGADEGYVYVRAEYPLAVERVRKAVKDAEEMGILGENVLGTSSKFYIHVMEGAGAFVCGEETALIASIEGQRGMPRPKPPFPAASGLWGKPTIINNVETLATIPLIVRNGIEKFRSIGTAKSPGTKTFALTGHVANTGLIEVPFGATMRQIIFEIGGGVTDKDGKINNDSFKAVQIGGPSGGCLTKEHLDLPLDFDSLTSIGAMVGSGGLVVMNDSTCMIKVARYFMQFTQNESCGKCVLCREGTKQMLALLDEIIDGTATDATTELLVKLGNAVKKGSLCGLGKTAPNPVLSVIKYFPEEYNSHINKKICPTGECKALTKPEIKAELCKGCTLCARKCPVGAISGTVKQPHTINADICIRCGVCAKLCKFNAIEGVA